MEAMTVQQVAEACGGETIAGAGTALVRRVATDSRHVEPGDAFVALTGERFDGHDFVHAAASRGATAVVVERERLQARPPVAAIVAVENTRRALGRWAAWHRRQFGFPVIAVAGSNGKTSTKDLLASVLACRYATLASEASFNNDVGVPLTLLRLERRHQVAVLEAGTNHRGELPALLRMIQPIWGVLTSLGREHLEFLGGFEGVIEEEGWLAELLPETGRLVVNGDSPGLEAVVRRARAVVTRVGWGGNNDWRIRSARNAGRGQRFTMDAPLPSWSGEYAVGALGRHQATNAALALAVAAGLGVAPEQARQGLTQFQPPPRRLQLWEGEGVAILDDCYNANADSTGAALETLRDLPRVGRCVAVLGDMAELGDHSRAAHAEVGERAVAAGVQELVAVGHMAGTMAAAARAAGLGAVREYADAAAAAAAAGDWAQRGDLVLVKASRSTRLETVVERLKEQFARGC